MPDEANTYKGTPMHEESRDALRAEREAERAAELEAARVIGSDEAISLADSLIDDLSDDYQRSKLRAGSSRRDFAMVAANIADDRYSAGSTAAKATVYILLTHGIQAAKDFAADLEHHEH